MKKICIFVSDGDAVSEVYYVLKALSVPDVEVKITRQSQIDDIWTHNGATVHHFEGSMAEVIANLEDRCHAATGYPDSADRCKFVMATTIEISK